MNNKPPKNWKRVTLGELLDYERPDKYIVSSEDYSDSYKTPVLTAGKTFILGYTNDTEGIYKNLPVIIFDDFTTESKYVDFDFKVKSSAMKILKAENNITLKYLYYLMQTLSFNHDTHKRYWISEYSKLKIDIPDKIEEQQEIVQVLDTMSNIIRLREECISHAQELIPALFQEMFKQYIKQKDKHISIGSVTSDTKQINPLKFFETEFYYIDIASINNDTGIIETPKIININETPPSRARKLVQTNDVIISMTRPYLKGFSIIPKHLDGQIVSTGFSVLRSIPEKILPLYLFAYARTDMFVGQLIPKMKGANYPAVRDSDVRSVKIPLPPIELQEQFAEKVEKINSYIKEQQEELANAKQMFQSLLHHAFTGELTRRAYGKI